MANQWKREMVLPWIHKLAPGKRVLDVFCANGAFSFESARAGAHTVVGVDYDPPRIACAQFIRGLVQGALSPALSFQVADV
jgi:tRNA (mo5U34)-methyltransferase